jgi:hypothetical protein
MGLVVAGVAMASIGLFQWLNWSEHAPVVPHDYNSVAVCLLIFAFALLNTKSRASALLFVPCLGQLWLTVKANVSLSDLYTGWGREVPFKEYAEELSTTYLMVSLGTLLLGICFVSAVVALERED